jgi:hypothetical protein
MFALMACFGSLGSGLAVAQYWPAACGPENVEYKVSKQASAGPVVADPAKATLVFVQRFGPCLGCSTTRVGLDGGWVGAVKGGAFFSVTVPAGEHHVCAVWSGPMVVSEGRFGLTELQAEAGKVYYFEPLIVTFGQGDRPMLLLNALSGDMGAFLVGQSDKSASTAKGK